MVLSRQAAVIFHCQIVWLLLKCKYLDICLRTEPQAALSKTRHNLLYIIKNISKINIKNNYWLFFTENTGRLSQQIAIRPFYLG